MKPAGEQILVEFGACRSDLLGQESQLLAVLNEAVNHSGFKLVKMYSHEYEPQGITAVAIVCESHIVLHTYPEAAHVSLDIFTCSAEPKKSRSLIAFLRESLMPSTVKVAEVKRGNVLELKRPKSIALSSTNGIDVTLQVTERVHSERTEFQNVEVFQSSQFGRLLVADGELLVAEVDAELYASTLVEPLLQKRCSLSQVLLIADCQNCLLSELLKIGAGEIVVASIDSAVGDICRRFLHPFASKVLDDNRVESSSETAFAYLASEQGMCSSQVDPRIAGRQVHTAAVYDLSMHPQSFVEYPREQFIAEMLDGICRRVQRGGGVCIQCGSEFDFQTVELVERLMNSRFSDIEFRHEFIPSRCGRWVFAFGCVS